MNLFARSHAVGGERNRGHAFGNSIELNQSQVAFAVDRDNCAANSQRFHPLQIMIAFDNRMSVPQIREEHHGRSSIPDHVGIGHDQLSFGIHQNACSAGCFTIGLGEHPRRGTKRRSIGFDVGHRCASRKARENKKNEAGFAEGFGLKDSVHGEVSDSN